MRRLARACNHLATPAASTAAAAADQTSAVPSLSTAFARDGFVPLGPVLTVAEAASWEQAFDRDRQNDAEAGTGRWVQGGIQLVNYDVLVTSPQFDQLVRHPAILHALKELMAPDEQPSLDEISLRYMPPGGRTHQDWHRDHPHAERRRHRCGYYVLMLYLSDVTEESPCLTVSPEAANEPALAAPFQLQKRGKIDVQGRAGTAILMNLSVLHRASAYSCPRGRLATVGRKSLQLYYAHRTYRAGDRGTAESWADEMRRWKVERPPTLKKGPRIGDQDSEPIGVNVDPEPGAYLSLATPPAFAIPNPSLSPCCLSHRIYLAITGLTEETLWAAAVAESAKRDAAQVLADTSIIPPALWRDHTDPEVRAFYTGTKLNSRSIAYAAQETNTRLQLTRSQSKSLVG
eukprot:COSAG05_NODE_52_length_23775_cov_49.471110_21_plen_403_part_00